MAPRPFVALFVLSALAARPAAAASSDNLSTYPTKVFSAPYALRPGRPLDEAQLAGRLARLRYLQVAGEPSRPGTYRKSGGAWELALRGFSHPLRPGPALRVRLTLESGRVRSLHELPSRAAAEGAALGEALLEPELIYEITGRTRVRREPVALTEVPRHLLDAVVAVEDKRFHSHHGVDLRGMARAAWRDLRSARLAEGGSTLTQQLARNVYLSPRRTFARKAQEIGIALYLEARYSKHDILRMYLDQVYLGQDGPVSVCGVKAAARFYFDKPTEKLTLGESALLAGMLRSPYRYNPFRSPDQALARRRVVLKAMRDQDLITREEETKARLEPLRVTRAGHEPPRAADFFVAYIQEDLERRYPEESLIADGLTIHTTLDPWLQQRAQQAVAPARQQAALVALDPADGAIRAMIGGKDFVESPFNRASSARRQPGSAFKPFLFGAALRAPRARGGRWTAASPLPDARRTFSLAGSTWTPRNYDGVYRGTTTLREALALSLNAASLQLASEVTPARIIEYARALGIRSELKPELGLALGASEVTLLELTGAYCAFANGGRRVEPFGIETVVDADGDVLEYRTPLPVPVLAPGEAWLITDLLRESVATGTARGLRAADAALAEIAAGKTGTTDLGRDAWFIGYTPRLVCGVWTGKDQPAPLPGSGATAALPLWTRFMRAAESAPAEDDPWPRPPDVVSAEIDDATGLRARGGCPSARTEHFLAGTEPQSDCEAHAAGVVGWLKRLLRR